MAARSALGPAVATPRGAEAAEHSWGHSGPGTRSGSLDPSRLPSPGSCLVLAGPRPRPGGLSSSALEARCAGRCPAAPTPGPRRSPRRPRGPWGSRGFALRWAPPTRAGPPGSRLWGSGRSGARRPPSLVPGLPGWEARIGDCGRQRPPDASPSSAPAAVRGGDARRPPPAAPRGARTACPTEDEGATAPGVPSTAGSQAPGEAGCWRPRLPLPACARPRPRSRPRPPGCARLPPPPGPARASPVSSRPPSSAHSRTPVSRQLTMVSVTRPARPVPALLAGHSARTRLARPPVLRPERPERPESPRRGSSRGDHHLPGNPRSSASSGRCAPAPEPVPEPAPSRRRRRRGGAAGVSARRAPSLPRTSIPRSRGRGRFINFPQPTSYPGTSFQ